MKIFMVLLAVLPALAYADGAPRIKSDTWAASWEAAPVFAVGPEIANQTVRQTVRLSIGGSRIRLRFSNESKTNVLVIDSVHLALPGRRVGSIDPATDRELTFNGRRQVSIPPGAPMYSDPVEFKIAPFGLLTVSTFIWRYSGPSTIHPDGNATTVISSEGDFAKLATLPGSTTSTARFFLSEVDVASTGDAPVTIVTLGDSITDGANSTQDRNRRWPDVLAERLAELQPNHFAVANAGISGNRILHDLPEASFGPSALARLDRDVLSVPGLKWVILLEGINDIGHSTGSGLPDQDTSAEQIIGGMRQIIARVSGRGAKIAGGTMTPFEGTTLRGYYTPGGEAKRQAVNTWMRTSSSFDVLIDFDAALRDPAHPGRMNSQYDSGDHLHPNDAGYRHMAEIVNLAMFQ